MSRPIRRVSWPNHANYDEATIQADNGAGLTTGIVGLLNKGQRRKPDDWGAPLSTIGP